jgi:hypothetical protein
MAAQISALSEAGEELLQHLARGARSDDRTGSVRICDTGLLAVLEERITSKAGAVPILKGADFSRLLGTVHAEAKDIVRARVKAGVQSALEHWKVPSAAPCSREPARP